MSSKVAVLKQITSAISVAPADSKHMRHSLALLLVSGLLPTIALGGAFGFVQLRAQ